MNVLTRDGAPPAEAITATLEQQQWFPVSAATDDEDCLELITVEGSFDFTLAWRTTPDPPSEERS